MFMRVIPEELSLCRLLRSTVGIAVSHLRPCSLQQARSFRLLRGPASAQRSRGRQRTCQLASLRRLMRLPQALPPLSHMDSLKLQVWLHLTGVLCACKLIIGSRDARLNVMLLIIALECMCNAPGGILDFAEELLSYIVSPEHAFWMWCCTGGLQAGIGLRLALMQMLQQHPRLQRRAPHRRMRPMPACPRASLRCVCLGISTLSMHSDIRGSVRILLWNVRS